MNPSICCTTKSPEESQTKQLKIPENSTNSIFNRISRRDKTSSSKPKGII